METAPIPYWRYLDEYERDRPALQGIVDRVLSSGRLILGPEVEKFENRFSSRCLSAFGIGVNSGTDALFLSLKALGVGPGDEVVTVSNTAVPTVAAIRATGATPVFVDVEEDSFLMDVARLEDAIGPAAKAVVPVHLFGQPADMGPLREIAKRRGLRVVEDCAQAAGALVDGVPVGSLGDLGAFSFYPTKVLGGFGDGGMVVTADAHLAARVRRLRFYGMQGAYYSLEEGYNSRLDELQAALLDFQLQSLDEKISRRREIARRYSRELAGMGDLAIPAVAPGRTHVFYAYTVRTQHRDGLAAFIRDRGIEIKVNYPVPVHRMSGYGFLGYGQGSLPRTERLAREILSLPIYPGLTDDEAGRVIEAVQSYYRSL